MCLLHIVGTLSDSPGRFYCRIVFTKKLGLDDYFIALALVVVTILAIFNVFQISWGAG
jgi:hypothetical protein